MSENYEFYKLLGETRALVTALEATYCTGVIAFWTQGQRFGLGGYVHAWDDDAVKLTKYVEANLFASLVMISREYPASRVKVKTMIMREIKSIQSAA